MEDKETKNPKEAKEAKQRIFDTAVSLFALKGYHGVGTREIAKSARVNIAMIHYYFEGKLGILKTIVNECHEKYLQMLTGIAPPDSPVEEHVRKLVHGIVEFFRENTALSLVGFATNPIDDPEVIALRTEWYERIGQAMKPFYDKLGANTADTIQMSLIRRPLIFTVMNLFESIYAKEQAPGYKSFIKEVDDNLYNRFADSLTNLYLYGYKGVINKEKPT
ncbi:MAG TPA: TetR family transcriptional regulator [bacterium]